ncbi:MAG: hypothetical protein AAGI38_21085 [Bacteroidota bacterium]
MKKIREFIISRVLLLLFLPMVIGCSTEDFFTDAELALAEVYSPGDSFSMLSNTGDTLILTIKERTLEEKELGSGEWISKTRYEELRYTLDISNNSGDRTEGEFWIDSQEFEALAFDFKTPEPIDNRFNGSFYFILDTADMPVNNVNYPDATCGRDACYSPSIGFVRFFDTRDTLTLIP